MPRYSFTQQASSSGDVDRFPRYKLDTGEKSRAWMPEEPWMEWMHRIEAPVIDHGETVLEVKDTKNGPVEVMKMDWIGSVFCLGETGTPDNPGPLMLAGIDPDDCPGCDSAARKTGVSPPVQRFAAPVIKYKILGRGPRPYDLASPISAEVLIWAYTGRVHGTLYELGSEHGDLRKHDIKLELEDTAAAAKWQRMKQIAIIVEPAYKNPKVAEYVRDLWKNHPENRPTDEQLRDACQGRDVPRQVFLDMVRRAERQWSQAENAGSGGGDVSQADAGFNGSLSEGIDSLLDSGPKAVEDPLAEFRDDPLAGHPGGLEEFASKPDPTVTGATTTATGAPAAESRSRTEPKSAGSVPSSSERYDRQDEADLEGRQRAAQQTLNEEAAKARGSAVEQAADDMFGETGNGSAKPEPAKPATRQRKAKAAEPPIDDLGRVSSQDDETRGGWTEAVASEPAKVPVTSGDVIDFDDLFKD